MDERSNAKVVELETEKDSRILGLGIESTNSLSLKKFVIVCKCSVTSSTTCIGVSTSYSVSQSIKSMVGV